MRNHPGEQGTNVVRRSTPRKLLRAHYSICYRLLLSYSFSFPEEKVHFLPFNLANKTDVRVFYCYHNFKREEVCSPVLWFYIRGFC